MKVAVISPDKMNCGKSSFIYLLAGVYSRSQGKSVSIYALEDTTDYEYMVTLNGDGAGTKSPAIFKALLNTGSVGANDIHDYALRVGTEEVHLFDFYSCTLSTQDKNNMFTECLAMDQSNLVLIEVHDMEDPFSKEVIEECDLVLALFTPAVSSINAIKDYQEKTKRSIVDKTNYVVSQYNPNVMSEAKLSRHTGLKVRSMLQFPYNTIVTKECLEGTLDTVSRYITKGHYELCNMRPKMQEVMEVIFNTPSHKNIKPVNEWRQ